VLIKETKGMAEWKRKRLRKALKDKGYFVESYAHSGWKRARMFDLRPWLLTRKSSRERRGQGKQTMKEIE